MSRSSNQPRPRPSSDGRGGGADGQEVLVPATGTRRIGSREQSFKFHRRGAALTPACGGNFTQDCQVISREIAAGSEFVDADPCPKCFPDLVG
jgi:hypothetical protein